MSGYAVARGDGKDDVLSSSGRSSKCRKPMVIKTNECSKDVFVNGIGVVREDDKPQEHKMRSQCNPDPSVLNSHLSLSVFINGKKAGRIGSDYTSGNETNIIIEGSQNTFIS